MDTLGSGLRVVGWTEKAADEFLFNKVSLNEATHMFVRQLSKSRLPFLLIIMLPQAVPGSNRT